MFRYSCCRDLGASDNCAVGGWCIPLPSLPHTESEELSAVFTLLRGQLPLICHYMENLEFRAMSLLFARVCSGRLGVRYNQHFILQCIFYGYHCASYTALDWPLPFPLRPAFSDASLTYGGSSLYTSYLYALPV
jgi:hypothetical protein